MHLYLVLIYHSLVSANVVVGLVLIASTLARFRYATTLARWCFYRIRIHAGGEKVRMSDHRAVGISEKTDFQEMAQFTYSFLNELFCIVCIEQICACNMVRLWCEYFQHMQRR